MLSKDIFKIDLRWFKKVILTKVLIMDWMPCLTWVPLCQRSWYLTINSAFRIMIFYEYGLCDTAGYSSTSFGHLARSVSAWSQCWGWLSATATSNFSSILADLTKLLSNWCWLKSKSCNGSLEQMFPLSPPAAGDNLVFEKNMFLHRLENYFLLL